MPRPASTAAVSSAKRRLEWRPSNPTTTPRARAPAASASRSCEPKPQPALITTSRFIRASPASTRPRSPAVPNTSGPEKRSARSFRAESSPPSARFSSASSSPRVSGSGSSARNARARAKGSLIGAILATGREALGCGVPAPLAVALFAVLPTASEPVDPQLAARFARLALACVHQEYPSKIAHVLNGDADARVPRELTPAFYGCYDWHSSVHGHWLLARVARLMPEAPFAADARKALAQSLTPANLAGELRYLEGKGRVSFERPYGLAWLLQLAAELREWGTPEARGWAEALAPARARGRRAAPRVAAEADAARSRRRALADRLRARARARLGARQRRRRDRGARRAAQQRLLCPRPRLPDGVRAVRRGLPVALPRRGGPDAPRGAVAQGVRALAQRAPAGAASRRPRRLAAARHRERPDRSQARAPRRPQPEPRLDARGHRRRAAGSRRARGRAPRRGGRPPPEGARAPSRASTTRAGTGSGRSPSTS